MDGRIAQRSDARAITTLLQNAPYSHIHADWHYPADWLGSSGFVVMDDMPNESDSNSLNKHFFGEEKRLLACLAVEPDPPPAAWVRVAAVSESVNGQEALSQLFELIMIYLKKSAISEVGWLLVESWPNSWIRDLGFDKVDTVETFMKDGTETPQIQSKKGLTFRAVTANDLGRLEEIEREVYQPLWRNSVAGLALARRHAFIFDVVEIQGKIVGFQYSTLMHKKAHLSRITIDTEVQGQGIGTALLDRAFEGYRQRGVETVSLNTQIENIKSRGLYERFGFRPSGQKFPVWVLKIT